MPITRMEWRNVVSKLFQIWREQCNYMPRLIGNMVLMLQCGLWRYNMLPTYKILYLGVITFPPVISSLDLLSLDTSCRVCMCGDVQCIYLAQNSNLVIKYHGGRIGLVVGCFVDSALFILQRCLKCET